MSIESNVKDEKFSLDEKLILINAYFLDKVFYGKQCIVTESLDNLVKEGYLIIIKDEGDYISYRGTKKGKKEGKNIVEYIEGKYFKETGNVIRFMKKIDDRKIVSKKKFEEIVDTMQNIFPHIPKEELIDAAKTNVKIKRHSKKKLT